MRNYVEKFSKLENSSNKIRNAWKAGNKSLVDTMGDDYYLLDKSEIGTAMVTDEDALNVIKQSLTESFGNIDGRTLTPLAKSVASGTYFKEIGKSMPEPISKTESHEHHNSNIVAIDAFEKENAKKEAERLAKAKQTGRGNPVFQKLMPGNLNGKYMGKTGKFIIEYPIDEKVADVLKSKVGDIADFADEELGNEDYEGKDQRIFVSNELQKEDTAVCVVMYHGIQGYQNKDISAAVKDAIRDAVPNQSSISIGKTYSVLNTELRNAEAMYAVQGFDISKYAPKNAHVRKLEAEQLNESYAPQQEYEPASLSL